MMNHSRGILWPAVVAVALGAGGASADYETHPDLHPDVRCGGAPSELDGRTAPPIPPSFIVENDNHPWDGRIVFKQQDGTYTDSQGRVPSDEEPGAAPVTESDLLVDENGNLVVEDPGGVDSLHCQKLFWDLPTPTALGAVAIGAPFDQDTIPRWPNGLTDRLVALYVENGEGYEQAVNPETGAQREPLCPEGTVPWWAPVFDENGDGYPDEGVREPIIRNFDELQSVAQALTDAGRPSYVFDPLGHLEAVGGNGAPQEGEVFRLDCRRGVRTYYGPWQTGVHPNVYDKLFPGQATRFDTTAILDADAAAGRICEGDGPEDVCICDANLNGGGADLNSDPVRIPLDSPLCADKADGEEVLATGRREWNTGSDFYNHFASHHGTCWNPETGLTSGALDPQYTCNDPEDPWAASDYGEGGECESYQRSANEPENGGTCYAGDSDPDCSGSPDGQMFRNATQYPGRLYVEIPDNRGVVSLEKQIWRCDHHVVTQLPPGSYSMTKLANYRLQKGGVRNPRIEGVNCGKAEDDDTTGFDESRSCHVRLNGETFDHAEPARIENGEFVPGGFIGGSAGEMVIQYFTDAFSDPNVKPVNVQFEVIQDALTTWYPPFTFHAHNITWYAPFDMAIGLITTHSHHRNSLGYMDITPNPVRPNGRDPQCGGSANGEQPPHVFTNTDWEDAKLCEYWKEPDGPLVMRKGQSIKTTCYVNNGITPEAIKHGLLPGSLVEAFRAYNEAESGDPVIPEDPSTVEAWSDDPSQPAWGNIFAESPVGREFLYGTHPPINYRVAYKCGPMPGFTPILPFAGNAPVCNPNPAEDADGDYIDGAYPNEEQCGNAGGWCNPSTIIFANVGEDEMCIPVFMYWRLDQLVESDGSINQETQTRLTEGAEHSFEEGDPQYFLDAVDQTGTPGVIQKWPGDIGDCRDCKAAGW